MYVRKKKKKSRKFPYALYSSSMKLLPLSSNFQSTRSASFLFFPFIFLSVANAKKFLVVNTETNDLILIVSYLLTIPRRVLFKLIHVVFSSRPPWYSQTRPTQKHSLIFIYFIFLIFFPNLFGRSPQVVRGENFKWTIFYQRGVLWRAWEKDSLLR